MPSDEMIRIDREVFMGMKALAEDNHPNEVVVLLRGNRSGGDFHITEYLIPPFGFGSRRSASFPAHMLPMDFSIMGTAHSHPSGNVNPSTGDMHNFYGRLMIILGPPYSMDNVAAYTKQGKVIPIEVVSG